MEDDKERYDVPVGFEPRTPVTVTSSFEEKWLHGVSTPTLGTHAPLPMNNGNGKEDVSTSDKGKAPADAQWRVDHSNGPAVAPKVAVSNRRGVGPGITYVGGFRTGFGVDIYSLARSVFPRFSYPDVNFWIW